MSFHSCSELLLFNYAKVKTSFHSMAPLMFLCHVACKVWLGQIYPGDILLLDALLCHIW